MIPWRVARSLLKLRDQLKAVHPSMPNPGFIGDAAHATRDSDHNPWVDDPASSLNVVTAGDWYDDEEAGFDAGKFAETLKRAKDPRVKYVISNRRIWSLARDREGWRPYNGSNPHTGHTHVSVSSTKSLYDSTRLWVIGLAAGAPTTPKEPDDVISTEQMQDLKNYIDASTNASARRWALWLARYQIQTEDERAKADQAYDDAIKAGKSPLEAMSAVVAVMRPLDEDLAETQAGR